MYHFNPSLKKNNQQTNNTLPLYEKAHLLLILHFYTT